MAVSRDLTLYLQKVLAELRLEKSLLDQAIRNLEQLQPKSVRSRRQPFRVRTASVDREIELP